MSYEWNTTGTSTKHQAPKHNMARTTRGRGARNTSEAAEDAPKPRGQRGRPPKNRKNTTNNNTVDSSIIDEIIEPSEKKRKHEVEEEDDDEYTGEVDDEEEEDEGERTANADAGEEGDEGEEDGEEDEEEEEEEGATAAAGQSAEKEKKVPKKRGRKKLKLVFHEDGVLDEEGNPLQVDGDEIVIENEDEKGVAKVEKNGALLGGRVYRMKTFTILNHGDTLYMVSTEPARLVGFRDSYLLFKTHRTLFKKVCTHEEKMDLIHRQIIPNSYKGRSVNLVTARSIFREFGARMIIDGKKVIDDFWEQRAIDRGDVSGDYADPAEFYVNKHLASGLEFGNGSGPEGSGSTPVPPTAALASSAHIKYQSDPTWMYQIAMQTSTFNRRLQEERSLSLIRGLKDTYTGISMFPQATQPTKAKVVKLADLPDVAPAKNQIVSDICFFNPDISRKVTGLKDVPMDIFDDVDVAPEVRKAILDQQKFERSF